MGPDPDDEPRADADDTGEPADETGEAADETGESGEPGDRHSGEDEPRDDDPEGSDGSAGPDDSTDDDDVEEADDGDDDVEEADDEPEPIDDGVPDWDVGRDDSNADGDTDEDDGEGGFEIPSDVDIREGYEDYEERVDFDADASERTTEVDLEEVETVNDPDSTAFERKAASGPQTDEEQPLAVHIEEMVKRLAIVIAIAGAVSLAAFPFAEDVVIFLWYSILPGDVSQPHVYHPLELVLTQLKTASLAGLIIALPAFVYETYAFMRPGLYPHERRYYLAAVPTSLILAVVGVSFAYFIVLPAVMNYFLYYSETVVDIAFALGQTFNLFLILMGYLALVFQIPLFIMLAIMMGLTTREWMEGRRLIFWGVFLGLSFLFSPDPTGMAPIIVAATMVALFEGTLLVLRWANRG